MEILRRGKMLGNLKYIENLAELVIRSCGSNKSYYYKEVTRLVTKAAILGGDTRNLMICYQNKHISKDDFANTLRAHQAANDELNTVQRAFAMRYSLFDEGN